MFNKPIKTLIHQLIGLAVFFSALSIQAHTPYVAPLTFEPVMGNMASFDAAFAEHFFIAEKAFDNSEFQITTPAGKTISPDSVTRLKTRVVIEHQLKDEGTYRLTTGARVGAEFYIYELEGKEKRAMDPKKPLPKGAKIKQHFRSITRADTYISNKKPNNTALKVEQIGLQLLPLTNPNEVFAEEVFQLKLLHDGKPLSKHELLAYPASTKNKPIPLAFESNKNGVIHVTLPQGKYLLRARYRTPAPKNAKVPTYSHTTTLSLQVFENI
ncbi:MAG: DUF4198 domain-containing protein [Spongiibacteraceae bacterium]|nr:DUF4198 domain-containing protein [Spongiibacteraceae bacterium]